MHRIILGDNSQILPTLPDGFARLIYIDPPFNTGRNQSRGTLKYTDSFEDYEAFLMPRIIAALHCLPRDGSLMVHIDQREVHYVKVALDKLLGRANFMNELIWSYDFGGRSKRRWPAKHDTILWYVLDPKNYIFNYGAMDRIPYMAPGLCGKEKAERGKTRTDVIWQTIVPTSGREKTGYPSQKPRGLIDQFIRVHTNPGDTVLDFFCGSGTTGVSAAVHGRHSVLVDQSLDAVRVAAQRLKGYGPACVGFEP